jgi:hypothetical protein
VIGPLRTAFELALRGSRVPLDVTLQVTGRRDSMHELRIDRAEAEVRNIVGTVLGDAELREQGERGLTLAAERQDAARAATDADGWTT